MLESRAEETTSEYACLCDMSSGNGAPGRSSLWVPLPVKICVTAPQALKSQYSPFLSKKPSCILVLLSDQLARAISLDLLFVKAGLYLKCGNRACVEISSLILHYSALT